MSEPIPVAIWLDDLRDPLSPDYRDIIRAVAGDCLVLWAVDVGEFKDAFNKYTIGDRWLLKAVFFDNDLGGAQEGRHAFTWMEERVRERELPEFTLYAQTANPAAKRELDGGFRALEAYWDRLRKK